MQTWLIAMLLMAAGPDEATDDVLRVKQGEGLKPLEIKGRVVDEGKYYIVYYKKGKSDKIYKENVIELVPGKRAALKVEPKDKADAKMGVDPDGPTKAGVSALPPVPDPKRVEKTNLPPPPDAPPPTMAEGRAGNIDPETIKKFEFLIVHWKWIVGGAVLATALMVVILGRVLPARTAGPGPAARPQNEPTPKK